MNISITKRFVQVPCGRHIIIHRSLLILFLLGSSVTHVLGQHLSISEGDPMTLLQLRLGMTPTQVDSAIRGLSAREKNIDCRYYQGEEYCYYYDSLVATYADSVANSLRLISEDYRLFDYKTDEKAISLLRGWLSVAADGLTKKYGKPTQVINRITGLNRASYWSALNQREGEFPSLVWKVKGVTMTLGAGVRSNGKSYVYRDWTDSDYGYTDWLYYGVITLEKTSADLTKNNQHRSN